MKKRIIVSLLFVLIIILGTMSVNADTYNDFTYTVNEDGTTVTITDYSDTASKEVVIPNTIDGKKVTIIGRKAFEDNGLISVIIPEGVTIIGTSAFSINKLTNVTIPSTVIAIGSTAFQAQRDDLNQPLLKKVVIFSKNAEIGNLSMYDVFNYSMTSDFKIYGYTNSTVESYANATYLLRRY